MYTRTIDIELGSAYVGVTLKAKLFDLDGNGVGDFVTSGFVEIGGGDYQWMFAAFPDDFDGSARFFKSDGTYLAFAGVSPTDDVEAQLRLILAACQQWNPARVNSSAVVIEGGKHLITIRGDAYYTGGPPGRGPATWTLTQGSESFPDFAGATVVLTSRRVSNDAVELTASGSISGPVDGVVTIAVAMTAEQTAALTPGDRYRPYKTNKFDVQITLASGQPWTPVRGGEPVAGGGHTIIEDQTRGI